MFNQNPFTMIQQQRMSSKKFFTITKPILIMKHYLKFLSIAVLSMSIAFISSCGGDDDGDAPVIPPAKIKIISFNNGDDIESWEFTYDANDRVTSISNIYDGGTPESILYDYTVAGQLTINKGGNITVYALNAEGRVSKEFWNAEKTEWEGYEYNADGIMNKIVEHYDGTDHNRYTLTITNKNVTNRIRHNDDGSVREDREFSFTIGDNVSGLHQIYAVDSEWKHIGGTFGKQSAKLASAYVRKITADPTSTFGATFAYTFDAKNRVATQTKNGTSSGGSFTEVWTYTYYED